jgi:N-succinyldiaminopimelate aminotransferase
MNPHLRQLQPYPFEKLRHLLAGVTPPRELAAIDLSVGEPKHAAPAFVRQVLADNLAQLAAYPATRGCAEVRTGISTWLQRRFALNAAPDPEREVLPVNGTREALFAFAQCVIDPTSDALVVMPNPFYQIYEGAALLAGATTHLLPCTAATGLAPDYDAVPAAIWRRCQLLYICSPGNPTGAVTNIATLKKLLALADAHDFIIASDECYSEIYGDENRPPPGLLQACAELGRDDFRRCVVFHSLSKRSNLPGLRSGFVAGDADILEQFLRYRTYHGCAMSLPSQLASAAAWADEAHVRENRRLYREKFDAVLEILGAHLDVARPDAGFYLWPRTPIDDETFTRRLLAEQHVTVVPGRYLARTGADGVNPGEHRVRIALVAPLGQCREAAIRIRHLLASG